MLYSSRYALAWLAILVAGSPGCLDEHPPSLPVATAVSATLEPHISQQGRLLLGFKDPDVRTFSLPTVVGARVAAAGELVANGGLGGHDFAGMPVAAASDGATIQMRIADVIGPSAPGDQWQYALEQWDPATAQWTPACAEPLLIIPPNDPASSPPLALAMPGTWTRDGLYMVNPALFSFACKTGVVAKCDGWGFSPTADPPDVTENGLATTVTGPDMMQACTRMARADYCALGSPNTLDGTPILIDDIFRTPDPVPGYEFEAAWAGLAVAGRIVRRPPVVCLTKLRWSTLPLGGNCPLLLPDPRVDAKGTFCDDLPPATLEKKGALTYSASSYLDAGLYTYTDPTSGTRLTTSSLQPQAVGLLPAWRITPPPGIGFPQSGQPVRFEATIFAPVLPIGISETNLVKLTSYQCPQGDLVTTAADHHDPSCSVIADEGYVYPPNTPGRAPLRRWWSPSVRRSYTTASAPTTMIAGGWQLTEVIGAVIRAAIDVNLRWSALSGATFSLDVQTRTGEWISPCLDTAQIGTASSVVFRGVCVSAANRSVTHADIAAFRINYTRFGVTQSATQAYDGVDSDAYVDLPGGKTTAVAVTWNEVGAGFSYAFDVRPVGGKWIACVASNLLANGLSHVHTGSCPSAGTNVKLQHTEQLRVCATRSGDEKNRVCTEVDYDGARSHVAIELVPIM